MEIYTIGFTKKTAGAFFGTLRAERIRRLVDVRISNTSQLAGFAKRDDLPYFLAELVGADYVHEPMLGPTRELLKGYRAGDIEWDMYERVFVDLMRERRIEEAVPRSLFDERTVLLCSEPTPEQCHRRLVLEYLNEAWGGIDIVHL